MEALQKMPIECGKEMLIEIEKDGKGLGISIVGGSDTVLGTIMIHEVIPGGAAAIDGRLRPGDSILEVNGVSLRNVTHEIAISSLRRTSPNKVRLLVYRTLDQNMALLDPTQFFNIFEVELMKKPGRGLGLSIVGRKNEPGVYISEIVKGGVAEIDGRLMQGDQILAVNKLDVIKSMQEDVAAILKTTSGKVCLKVGRWKVPETIQRIKMNECSEKNCISTTTQQQEFPLQQQQNMAEEMTAFGSGQNGVQATIKPPPPPPAPYPSSEVNSKQPPMFQITVHDENNQQVRSDLSPVSEEDLKSIAEAGSSEEAAKRFQQQGIASTSTSSVMPPTTSNASTVPESTSLREDLHELGSDTLLILLKKEEGQQWGMGIGKRPRGILITSLQPGSSAAEKLLVGDRILAVNGNEVVDQHSAVKFVKSSGGNKVALQIARPQKGVQISFK